MNKVIMIVTNKYNPDIRVHKEAMYLVSKGYEVEVICWDRENECIDRESENIDGVNIKRFFPFSKYGSGLKQIRAYITFLFEVKLYLSRKKYRYLHCHDLDGMLIGLFSNSSNSKLIFDMHEFYEMQGEKQKYKSLIKRVVRYLQNASDAIIYVNDIQVKNLEKKNIEKLLYIPNYPIISDYLKVIKKKNDGLQISYIGAVRQYKELKNLMEACDGIENVRVSIHGSGTSYRVLNSIKDNYINAEVTGSYGAEEIFELYSKADILYSVYSKDNPQHMISYPVKFFEAIVTKTPMIVSKGSVLEKFVVEKDIGFAVDGENVDEIKNLVTYINDNKVILEKCIRNLEKIQFNYSWEEVVKRLDEIYV
ncbi:glycosyltransferase [Proteiniclasticum ruminis]|uniref:glycosyltransferase n=1 Tax=Proteiniclasticum ruminis TaxID=398199 RepID=UPI0028A68631|nr:glycosyltransferase [Proteiniclasticum ruminis]